ncbi:MAG: sugar transferase [Planctomycetes bacterium]|nr:sugar transferase [Planctomycetota bacterium]
MKTGPEPVQRGVFSLAGVDPARVHREWQMTNTLWAQSQRLVALLLLVLLLPLMLVLYLPVRLSARAPFFFRQKRPGFMGRDFTIWKITTMRQGSDKVAKYEKGVTIDDPNVTRIGRFLRDTKVDELPQLLNIVRGEMEFVGPRPIAPGLNRMLSAAIPGFNHRYLVKPGLTNVSQVSVLENAVGDKAIEDWKLRFEGEEHYIRNKSVSYDLILIALTSVFVLRKALRPVLRSKRRRGELVRMPGVSASKRKSA